MPKLIIPFKLKGINTKEFATQEGVFSKNAKTVELKKNIRFGINPSEKTLAVFFKCLFLQDNNPFIICEVICEFAIAPPAWEKQIQKETKRIIFPKVFTDHLAVITVGTTRGVLHTKLENTNLSQFMLPTVNIEKMRKDDYLAFDLETKNT